MALQEMRDHRVHTSSKCECVWRRDIISFLPEKAPPIETLSPKPASYLGCEGKTSKKEEK